jgi:hypothetical protein
MTDRLRSDDPSIATQPRVSPSSPLPWGFSPSTIYISVDYLRRIRRQSDAISVFVGGFIILGPTALQKSRRLVIL